MVHSEDMDKNTDTMYDRLSDPSTLSDRALFNRVGNLGTSVEIYTRLGDKLRLKEMVRDWIPAHREWVRRGQPGLDGWEE